MPASDIEALSARMRGSTLKTIHSRFGHDAFLKEETQVGAIITEFLASLEISQ